MHTRRGCSSRGHLATKVGRGVSVRGAAAHGITEHEIYDLVLCNETLDASIERLVKKRLDRAHGVEALVQVGRFKRQTGKHCLCHASDQAVWIGCRNKGSADADRGRCKHETGWFHPRCVGLAELRTAARRGRAIRRLDLPGVSRAARLRGLPLRVLA